MRRNGVTVLAALALLGFFTALVGCSRTMNNGVSASVGGAPVFEVDPFWPQPLPNSWLMGQAAGVAVDKRNHVWVVQRPKSLTDDEKGATLTPPRSLCCRPAPPVLEFDPSGKVVSSWGGPGEGYDWPESPGGIAVDAKGMVWIAATGFPDATPRGGRGGRGAPATTPPPPPGPVDAHVLQFTRTGKFVRQIGKPGVTEGSASRTSLNRPAGLEVDAAANELYVADGHGNRRIVVFDATSGEYKRHWGAYGAAPDDATSGAYDPAAPPSKQFRTVSCVTIARNGMVYVCDRQNNRIQVFDKSGKFVKEAVVAKGTLANGAVWDIALSADPAQRYLFVADGTDQKIFILQRDTLMPAGEFGAGGRWPGHFFGVGSVAVDSRGNVFTGETFEGKRVQKFAPRR
jgi:hypothetical protein